MALKQFIEQSKVSFIVAPLGSGAGITFPEMLSSLERKTWIITNTDVEASAATIYANGIRRVGHLTAVGMGQSSSINYIAADDFLTYFLSKFVLGNRDKEVNRNIATTSREVKRNIITTSREVKRNIVTPQNTTSSREAKRNTPQNTAQNTSQNIPQKTSQNISQKTSQTTPTLTPTLTNANFCDYLILSDVSFGTATISTIIALWVYLFRHPEVIIDNSILPSLILVSPSAKAIKLYQEIFGLDYKIPVYLPPKVSSLMDLRHLQEQVIVHLEAHNIFYQTSHLILQLTLQSDQPLMGVYLWSNDSARRFTQYLKNIFRKQIRPYQVECICDLTTIDDFHHLLQIKKNVIYVTTQAMDSIFGFYQWDYLIDTCVIEKPSSSMMGGYRQRLQYISEELLNVRPGRIRTKICYRVISSAALKLTQDEMKLDIEEGPIFDLLLRIRGLPIFDILHFIAPERDSSRFRFGGELWIMGWWGVWGIWGICGNGEWGNGEWGNGEWGNGEWGNGEWGNGKWWNGIWGNR